MDADRYRRNPVVQTLVAEMATQAIDLFVEYRDQYGYDEETAKVKALIEIAEGFPVTDADLRPEVR